LPALREYAFRIDSSGDLGDEKVGDLSVVCGQLLLRKTKLNGVPKTLQTIIDDLVPFLTPVTRAIESGSAFDQRWIAGGPWGLNI
jgi:hypothetical protein